VNYNKIFKEFKQLEDSLSACVTQYEERLKRSNDYMENSSSMYIKAQEDLKNVKVKFETEQKTNDRFI
jgi:Zn-finger domain-containing protein